MKNETVKKIEVEGLEGVTKLKAGSGKRILGIQKEKYCNVDCSLAVPKLCQADCCGMVPFYKDFVMRHKQDAKREVVKIIEIDVMTVILETKDLVCTFLDENYKCSVYDERPEICKKFGDGSHPALTCPYIKPNGKLRSKKGRIITRRKIDKYVDGELAAQKKELSTGKEDKAIDKTL